MVLPLGFTLLLANRTDKPKVAIAVALRMDRVFYRAFADVTNPIVDVALGT